MAGTPQAARKQERGNMLELIAIIRQTFIRVPDSGTTLSLLSIAVGAMVFIRAKLK
jgi:VPDSG-CTERM motif